MAKVYDEVSYKPASAYTFIGIVSSSPMPSPLSSGESEDTCLVPTIHVIGTPSIAYPTTSSDAVPPLSIDVRTALIDHLATAFDPPDRVAAEYLLLLLISRPTARPNSLPPLGTLSVNFLRPASSGSTSALASVVSTISPLVVPLALSIPLLHTSNFSPVSGDSSNLDAGLLQLAAGTVLIVEEDKMGEGGQLNEKAVKNLQAFVDCMSNQFVRYEYPYMDDLKMDCDLRVAVLSEGDSLLPVSQAKYVHRTESIIRRLTSVYLFSVRRSTMSLDRPLQLNYMHSGRIWPNIHLTNIPPNSSSQTMWQPRYRMTSSGTGRRLRQMVTPGQQAAQRDSDRRKKS